jgi:hypothetical protein
VRALSTVAARHILVAIAFLLSCAAPGSALAQSQPGFAEVTKLTGRVEALRKGQGQWSPTAVGARLADGDEVRAHRGGSAELTLLDGSTVIVAENSRLVVRQIDFDPQTRTRNSLFHLVAGKVRASVSPAATTLVRARQSNFSISTPTAVAAVRGTLYEVTYDVTQRVMRVAVLVRDPNRPEGVVTCTPLGRALGVLGSIFVREGLASIGCGPPVPISSLPDAALVGTLQNPIVPPPGAFNDPVSLPAIPPALTSAPGPTVIGTGFPGVGTISDTQGPSTTGADTQPASEPGNR